MATSDQVQQLYITYFGRPADPSGLAYWTADEATPLSTIAQGFATTPEFAADIEGRTLDQIVNSFYVDLFGRNAEPEGLAFWVNQIQIGNTTIQQAGLEIGNAALTTAAIGNADNVALTSKIAASDQWTDTVGASTEATVAYSGQEGIDAGVSYLLPVLTAATVPSEEATVAQIEALVQSNGAGGGSTLNLSVFQDVANDSGTLRLAGNGTIQETSTFKFTSTNQTVNATSGTFSGIANADNLVDGFTTDQDVFNITGLTAANQALGAGATITNIENFNIGLNSAAAGVATFANVTGAQAFTFTGTVGNNNQAGFNVATTGATTVTSAVTGGAASSFSITAGNGGNTITTSDITDVIVSGTGADTITTEGGDDTITAGNGADTINAGTGNNTITDAGFGADVITHDSANSTVAITTGGATQFTLNASTAGATLNLATANGSVNASGSSAVITYNVTANSQTIADGSAAGTITAFGGTNNISGNGGNDAITGNTGADTLSGGTGNDTITGAAGNDVMTGGAGADRFVQNANGVSTVASAIAGIDADISAGAAVWTFGNGVDVVTDFVGGTDEILSTAGGFPAATNNLLFGQAVDATAVVAGNYVVQGTWDGNAGTFTYGNGADVMFGFAGGGLNVIGNNGTRSAILVGGAAGFVAGDIV